jgi:predicted dehydrogenase
LHYPRTEENPYLLTATLRAHPLSQRTPQLRFTVRGSKGTFVKYGLDVQEDQMKQRGVEAFGKEWYGRESEDIYGELEVVEKEGDNAPIKSRLVHTSLFSLRAANDRNICRVTSEKGTYQELYKNLAAGIRENAELKVKWNEAAMVMLIVDLAIQSSKEGRTINVPTD